MGDSVDPLGHCPAVDFVRDPRQAVLLPPGAFGAEDQQSTADVGPDDARPPQAGDLVDDVPGPDGARGVLDDDVVELGPERRREQVGLVVGLVVDPLRGPRGADRRYAPVRRPGEREDGPIVQRRGRLVQKMRHPRLEREVAQVDPDPRPGPVVERDRVQGRQRRAARIRQRREGQEDARRYRGCESAGQKEGARREFVQTVPVAAGADVRRAQGHRGRDGWDHGEKEASFFVWKDRIERNVAQRGDEEVKELRAYGPREAPDREDEEKGVEDQSWDRRRQVPVPRGRAPRRGAEAVAGREHVGQEGGQFRPQERAGLPEEGVDADREHETGDGRGEHGRDEYHAN